jgi:hypothetical protein
MCTGPGVYAWLVCTLLPLIIGTALMIGGIQQADAISNTEITQMLWVHGILWYILSGFGLVNVCFGVGGICFRRPGCAGLTIMMLINDILSFSSATSGIIHQDDLLLNRSAVTWCIVQSSMTSIHILVGSIVFYWAFVRSVADVRDPFVDDLRPAASTESSSLDSAQLNDYYNSQSPPPLRSSDYQTSDRLITMD